jgi:hypothetical protein
MNGANHPWVVPLGTSHFKILKPTNFKTTYDSFKGLLSFLYQNITQVMYNLELQLDFQEN